VREGLGLVRRLGTLRRDGDGEVGVLLISWLQFSQRGQVAHLEVLVGERRPGRGGGLGHVLDGLGNVGWVVVLILAGPE
jgi:hypothetical protein